MNWYNFALERNISRIQIYSCCLFPLNALFSTGRGLSSCTSTLESVQVSVKVFLLCVCLSVPLCWGWHVAVWIFSVCFGFASAANLSFQLGCQSVFRVIWICLGFIDLSSASSSCPYPLHSVFNFLFPCMFRLIFLSSQLSPLSIRGSNYLHPCVLWLTWYVSSVAHTN